jgi:hypothetical protein
MNEIFNSLYNTLPVIIRGAYVSLSKSSRTGRLERDLRMVQLSATTCSFIAILWVSLVCFASVIICVPSQRVFVVFISLSTQSGNFWIHPRMFTPN